mgnify:CR=1 FL=1|tara:strand:+ start:382 stop:654 length:273 start_codon:yes stop_codon:yes gene_type:complete
MGSPEARLKKPNQGMFGNFKGSPKQLLNEFEKAKAEKGELEALRSVRKKYNIKKKYTYPREAGLLAQEQEEEEESKKKGYKLSKKNLLGQ